MISIQTITSQQSILLQNMLNDKYNIDNKLNKIHIHFTIFLSPKGNHGLTRNPPEVNPKPTKKDHFLSDDPLTALTIPAEHPPCDLGLQQNPGDPFESEQ